ncbi:thioredoxin domain-containing protein [Flavobacterium sp. LS1R49]|uniref:Thioredoxin domain-containing protein n=1 Tax=Flavobacterium shii TaxID=2987687 RepID=A0A9X2ZFB4_9FLAO|nr:vitamin K epoxide reductase family protein [Flavobacterium shii]MCV9930346.1 thioredoxin domain-containing protein [Flavobacterium shii]
MKENFNYLFQYLEKESISIDKSEFSFQIQSHPNYPTLLSIVDTLSFFNITNGAIHVDFLDIECLSGRFVALLNEDQKLPEPYFLERNGDDYFYLKEKKAIKISKLELERIWNGIVLLVEKSETDTEVNQIKKSSFWVLPFLCSVLFFLYLSQLRINWETKLFFAFPVIGIIFSIGALKDLFGTKSELLNSFCNMKPTTSCSTVVASNKWKIFEIINFSDLSMIFFTSQFLLLFLSLLLGDTITYFAIQKILLLAAIPILLLSLYYQKVVEKKWCPICLAITTVILLEIIYLFLLGSVTFIFYTTSLIIFALVTLLVITAWSSLKKNLYNQKELKEYQLKSIRFERNYEIFKNSLFSKEKNDVIESPIILGNKYSKTIITIISNPFCGHCEGVHEIIDAILEKYHEEVQVQIILKTNLDKENEDAKKMFRSLINIYMQDGESRFTKALNKWFESKNLEEWLSLFSGSATSEFDTIFRSQNRWCEDNDFSFTPVIFINGYEYPQSYDRKNLTFFVKDIIEDEF